MRHRNTSGRQCKSHLEAIRAHLQQPLEQLQPRTAWNHDERRHAEDSTRRYFFGVLDDGGEILDDVFEVREVFVQFIRDFANTATDVNHDTVRRKSLPVQAFGIY